MGGPSSSPNKQQNLAPRGCNFRVKDTRNGFSEPKDAAEANHESKVYLQGGPQKSLQEAIKLKTGAWISLETLRYWRFQSHRIATKDSC